MALSEKKKKEIKELEKDIIEGESLWQKLKRIPKKDKQRIEELKKPPKKRKKKPSPRLKKLADKIFWGIEPPKKK